MTDLNEDLSQSVAIIGMSGRFPGAMDIEEFWQNLIVSKPVMKYLDDNKSHPANFVPVSYPLSDIEYFDTDFFNITPREAELMDPQQRLLLECAIHAFEDAGYTPEQLGKHTGVFIGSALSTYLFNTILASDNNQKLGSIELMVGNESPATQISYRLSLGGPSINVNTTCSSSLTALHLACRSLLCYDCDAAIAGGVSINSQHEKGYFHNSGGILSSDGICRPFDAGANGTVGTNGAGLVLLKRWEDARKAGDHIYALIRGSAINNDGHDKVGYTAPSVSGQAQVITEALADARVAAESITYLETHGTGTLIGDSIEFRALKQVFAFTKPRHCALGAVKSNIGHLNTAAGVAGLIKAVLCLYHKKIVANLNFQNANPQLDIIDSPFYFPERLQEWHTEFLTRRAGVSSFGIGGTNAHIILEETPPIPNTPNAKANWQLLTFSANSPKSLSILISNMIQYLNSKQEINIIDLAYTLHMGRKSLPYKYTIVANDLESTRQKLCEFVSGQTALHDPKIVFMFPGQGAQHPGMGQYLYESFPEFRVIINEISAYLIQKCSFNLIESFSRVLDSPCEIHPCLFAIEYALAKLMISMNVNPNYLIGHSLGEYTVACLAEVLSLYDALDIIMYRAKLVESLPLGGMLVVATAPENLRIFLNENCSLAVVNSNTECVLSANEAVLTEIENKLKEAQIAYQRVKASRAFHSHVVDPVQHDFRNYINKKTMRPAKIPYVANLTGDWVNIGEVIESEYWVKHLRATVRFDLGLETLVKEAPDLILEVGPNQILSAILRRNKQLQNSKVTPLFPYAKSNQHDSFVFNKALGEIWCAGIVIDWQAFHRHDCCRRISLPKYPFDRKYCWYNQSKSHQTSMPDVQHSPTDEKKDFEEDLTIQQQICKIWRDILGIEQIKYDDNFFGLGGQSLLAAQIIIRIRETFKVDLAFNILFENPTINGMADLVLIELVNKCDPVAITDLVGEYGHN